MSERKDLQRLRFEIAYDGTGFCGWQTQRRPKEQPTIQDELHRAVTRIFGEDIHFHGSGRTDSGVHAWGQVAHADVGAHLPFDRMDIPAAFRAHLPGSIVIKNVWLAPEEFHAQHSAVKKTYKYLIFNNKYPHPHLRNFSLWYKFDLDLEKLSHLSSILVGRQDFASFQSTGTPVTTTVRTIFDISWKIRGSGLIEMKITGDGFLKQMVRNIVGTLIQLQRGADGPEKLTQILQARDRQAAGPTASPEGLRLWRVYYKRELDRKCHQL